MIINNDFQIENEAFEIFFSKYADLKKLNISIKKGPKNTVKKENSNCFIEAIDKVYVFRMISFLIKNDNDFYKEEIPESNRLTFYTDCSRNAVLNYEYFKDLVLNLALLGYNNLSLYTEDTFEVDGEPYFGHMRGRYTKDEIKRMVSFSKMFGIMLIPGIATLAHLNNIFFWPEYEPILDKDDIILIGDGRTYKLFDNIFRTLSEEFEAREVHIGFDEAHSVCLGKYYELHGNVDRTKAVLEHLNKIIEIAGKYGFKISMWSDMFFKLQYGQYYLMNDDFEHLKKEVIELIPKDIELVYWDYYHVDYAVYDRMMKRHLEITDNVAFAGGAWNWLGFAPFNKRSIIQSKYGLISAKENNIKKVYLTAWGDNGNECSRRAIMPSLVLYAESYNAGNVDEDNIDLRIRQLTGLTLEDFYTLDILNEYKDNPGCQKGLTNPAKFVLYSDPLLGLFDYDMKEEYVEYFKECLKKLEECSKKESDYKYVFETLVALSKVMIDKMPLGMNLVKAYKENNKEYLIKARDEIIPKIKDEIIAFEKLLRKQWFKENKTIGYDVLQVRIGGQKNRLDETILRLDEYLKGEISNIEELEIPRITQRYSWEDEYVYKHNYTRMGVPNINS